MIQVLAAICHHAVETWLSLQSGEITQQEVRTAEWLGMAGVSDDLLTFFHGATFRQCMDELGIETDKALSRLGVPLPSDSCKCASCTHTEDMMLVFDERDLVDSILRTARQGGAISKRG